MPEVRGIACVSVAKRQHKKGLTPTGCALLTGYPLRSHGQSGYEKTNFPRGCERWQSVKCAPPAGLSCSARRYNHLTHAHNDDIKET